MELYGLVTLVGVVVLLVLEPVLARNSLHHSRLDRWCNNIGLALTNEVIRFFLPLALALIAVDGPWQAFNASSLGLLWGTLLAFIIMDFSLYWVHRFSHELRWLWRLHRTHHSDLDMDVTTSFRHHPGEVGLKLILMSGFIGLLGFTPAHLLTYVLLHRGFALWSHSNIRMPESLERQLAKVLVTPRVHQIHHSAWQPETDSNYGQVLTLWDRLFKTYLSPDQVPCPARFGLENFRSDDDQRLSALFAQPIR